MTESDVVAIIQPFVPTYRVALFDALERHLADAGLRLEIWHDQPKGIVAARGNSTTGPWSVPIKQHRVSVRRRNVTYRHVGRRARGVRAVVAGLASSNVETYGLAVDSRVNLMLWGHGRNFTAGNNGLDARLESWLVSRASHVFAYTDAGSAHLVERGTPVEKITVVRNSTDTAQLRTARESTSSDDVALLREQYRLPSDARVALFVGAFDEPKRLPFLFEAADLLAEKDPAFVLMLAGAGPQDDYVAAAVSARPWARLLGRLDAAELGAISHVADVLLMPGRVGLVAVDSLALGIPLATTVHDFHAPEIEYLTPETSLWTDATPSAYAAGVAALLRDPERCARMAHAGREVAGELSADHAGSRFCAGILRGLERA